MLNGRGPDGSRNETVSKLWGLTRTTPGAIAASAMLVRENTSPATISNHSLLTFKLQGRWALSKDEYLQMKGTATGIDWHLEYECYLQYLHKGLRQHKASVINIFRVWDKTLFPHTDNSLSGRRVHFTTTMEATRDALDALNADAEDLGENDGDERESHTGSDDDHSA